MQIQRRILIAAAIALTMTLFVPSILSGSGATARPPVATVTTLSSGAAQLPGAEPDECVAGALSPLMDGATANGTVAPGETDYYDMSFGADKVAFSWLATGGTVRVGASYVCGDDGCHVWGNDPLPAQVGGGGCGSEGIGDWFLTVQFWQSPTGGDVDYVVYVDSCPPASPNAVCLWWA